MKTSIVDAGEFICPMKVHVQEGDRYCHSAACMAWVPDEEPKIPDGATQEEIFEIVQMSVGRCGMVRDDSDVRKFMESEQEAQKKRTALVDALVDMILLGAGGVQPTRNRV